MIIEVRSGEGGIDAKMLVDDYLAMYVRVCTRNGL